MYVCICVCIYTYIYVYVYTYVCVCVCAHACIYDVLTPTSLSWDKRHMEQSHSELFCIATALQLAPGMVI